MDEPVFLDIVSFFAGIRQTTMPLSVALQETQVCRRTGHQWAIHRVRDDVLLAETRGMKQAVIDAFKSGAMS